jgi:ATP-dependent DNA helicase RecG
VELQFLKGIGPKRAAAFEKAGITNVSDLLNYYPRRYADAEAVQKLRGILEYLGKSILVTGRVVSRMRMGPRSAFLKVVIQDDSGGTLDLVYFQAADYFESRFEIGKELMLIGRLAEFGGRAQVVQPEYVEVLGESAEIQKGGILPFYSLPAALSSARLTQPSIRTIMRSALDHEHAKAELTETLPPELLRNYRLIGRSAAIHSIHFPESKESLQQAIRRLKYEELFFLQLRLVLERRRNALRSHPGIPFDTRSLNAFINNESQDAHGLIAQFLNKLPFELTPAQFRVLREIAWDMSKQAVGGVVANKPMHRLLQGDVGSGKTIVALLAMLAAIENGYQAVLMAPTEILAEQHSATLQNFLEGLPINITLLTGGLKKKEKTLALAEIAEGTAHIAVGTHALLEEGVRFDRLGFVVIDEQHKFGVAQRKKLLEKAYQTGEETGAKHAPDVLIMTATPIPRTLSLTLYGDLDVSVIDEYPKNRKPIITKLLYQDEHEKLYQSIRNAVQQRGEQVFVVYPLVEESQKSDLAAATASFDELSAIMPDIRFGLLHGRLASKEKLQSMIDFKEKKVDVLVATTVVEVGIDIPNATAIIIEHAERFGLAQLHQLRGRVGRGPAQSFCILVASDKLRPRTDGKETSAQIEYREIALKRLETMVRTTNGFEIAEVDLEIRGPGEFFGTKQSGLPELQIADVIRDSKMFQTAHDDATELTKADPNLRKPEHSDTRKTFLARFQSAESFLGIG